MLARPLDAARRDTAMAAAGNAVAHTARWMLEVGGELEAERFIEAVRAIPAAR